MILEWEPYVLDRGEDVPKLWEAASGSHDEVWIVVGAGFDPRCPVAVEKLSDEIAPKGVTVVEIELPSADESLREAALLNRDRVRTAAAEVHELAFPKVSGRLRAGRQLGIDLLKLLPQECLLVIDVSALPSDLFFPIIASVIASYENGAFDGDLQVAAAENPALDAAIHDEGIAEVGAIAGFINQLGYEARTERTMIWAPVVGEGAGAALRAIYDLLEPHEVTPVLPFPSRNPRRADELLLEHRDLLIDEFQIDSGSIIYASEANPFDLYRTLRRLRRDYESALAPIGGANVVLSTHSSKLLSVGALLAAYRDEMPVVAAVPDRYDFDATDAAVLEREATLSLMWLTGEPYRP